MFKKTSLIIGMLTCIFATGNLLAAGDPVAGKAKSVTCVACHGAKGISLIPMYPNLAGQKSAYTAKQLKAFRDKTRVEPVMAGMSAGLTDTDIDNLAAYYESLK